MSPMSLGLILTYFAFPVLYLNIWKSAKRELETKYGSLRMPGEVAEVSSLSHWYNADVKTFRVETMRRVALTSPDYDRDYSQSQFSRRSLSRVPLLSVAVGRFIYSDETSSR